MSEKGSGGRVRTGGEGLKTSGFFHGVKCCVKKRRSRKKKSDMRKLLCAKSITTKTTVQPSSSLLHSLASLRIKAKCYDA